LFGDWKRDKKKGRFLAICRGNQSFFGSFLQFSQFAALPIFAETSKRTAEIFAIISQGLLGSDKVAPKEEFLN